MKIFKHIIIFLVINFAALSIGTWLMDNGPQTNWYLNLNKAPWTPPGWVFGVAWTTIMICFSIYMAYLFKIHSHLKLKILFSIQFVLNVSWNYVFFNQHLTTIGLINIILLTALVLKLLLDYSKPLKLKSIFILPYLIWLCIATSLNAYIVFNN